MSFSQAATAPALTEKGVARAKQLLDELYPERRCHPLLPRYTPSPAVQIIPREPRPRFDTNAIIPLARAVCESGAAYVFGYEWGPDSKATLGPGWIYWLIEAPVGGFPLANDQSPIVNGRRFAASEAEMVKWHKEANA